MSAVAEILDALESRLAVAAVVDLRPWKSTLSVPAATMAVAVVAVQIAVVGVAGKEVEDAATLVAAGKIRRR